MLSQVKLIAEPWDVGAGRLPGRQLPGAAGPSGTASTATASAGSGRATAARLASSPRGCRGSSDLYEWSGRRPYASINFVTCHDGFTLHDLVSYNDKHNEANGEDNRDGANDNNSWNCGVEGPTDDPAIIALRERQKRNLLATLLLSQGVPMSAGRRRAEPHAERQQQRLLPGQRADLARTGSWTSEQQEFLEFVRTVHADLAASSRCFQRRKFFQGRRDPRHGHQGHLLVRARRQGDDRRGLERRLRASAWACGWPAT